MKELIVPAKVDRLAEVIAFIRVELESAGCSAKVKLQIEVAVEEIYVNIASYAYRPKDGDATIRCTVEGEPLQVTVQFLDGGRPYNPLNKQDPDITLAAEVREIGGLGIFMVKKSMDSIEYEYADGKNILTIKKSI